MPTRGFGIQSLASTAAVPAFGCQLTAAANPTPDQFSGNFKAGSNKSYTVLSVANPYFFRAGDPIAIGPSSSFGLPGTTTGAHESANVISVNYGASTMVVEGLTVAHAATDFAILGLPCATIIIQPLAVAAGMYIGSDSTVGVASPTLIQEITAAQATAGVLFARGDVNINCFEPTDFWIKAGAGDTYIGTITII